MSIRKENCIVYVRYSSHNQDDGNSIAAQITTIETYTKNHNMEIEVVYTDMAQTGRNTNRPEYHKMLEDIKENRVTSKCLIVRSLDRLHRNANNQLKDLEWFEKKGIRFIAIVDNIDTATQTSKLLTTIKAAVAEDFSENLSKTTRSGMLECAKQCRHMGGIPPIGYKVNAEGLYEIDELKAPIVREIFHLYLNDMGYDGIIKHLKKKGYQTAKGRDFSKSSLNTILKNPKYKGTYVYDRSIARDSEGKRNSHMSKPDYITIENGMPAIIPPETFDKVQQKMKRNAKKHANRSSKNYYSLNGVIHCKKCGKAFSGNVNNSNGNRLFYYKPNCSCGQKSLKAEALQHFTFYAVQQCIFNLENKEMIKDKINRKRSIQNALQANEIKEINRRMEERKAAQDNLTEYLEKGKATQTIFEKMEKNETELRILDAQLKAKTQSLSIVDDEVYDTLVKQFVGYMSTEKTADAFALKEAVIKDIQVDEDNIEIIFQSGMTLNEETIDYFNDMEECG